MYSPLQFPWSAVRCSGPERGCARSWPLLLASFRSGRPSSTPCYVIEDMLSTAYLASRPCVRPLRATDEGNSGGSASNPGDEDDELDRLLGIGRYRDDSVGFFSTHRNRNSSGSNNDKEGVRSGGYEEAREGGSDDGAGGSDSSSSSSGLQDTLADIMQMEVRRIRAKEELMTDLEERKAQMRAIGEEMKAALAREFELDRQRTEIGANYAISEAYHALDDVEAEVARIKQQLQADKADLAAWEAQAAEDRSRGLFFKSLYSTEKEPRQPVGKSIPGFWRKQRAEAAAAAAAAAEATADGVDGAAAAAAAGSSSSFTPSPSSRWDPEAVAAAAERPLSAASRQVRSPLRLYLWSYLSAFLALLVVNDVALSAATAPHVLQDALYSMLSAGLGYMATQERQALGKAQEAMLEGIRRTARVGKPEHKGDQ